MQLTGSDCIDRTAHQQYECQESISGLVTDSPEHLLTESAYWFKQVEEETKGNKIKCVPCSPPGEWGKWPKGAKKIKFDSPFFIHICTHLFSHLFKNISSTLWFPALHTLVPRCHTVTFSKFGISPTYLQCSLRWGAPGMSGNHHLLLPPPGSDREQRPEQWGHWKQQKNPHSSIKSNKN